MGWQNWKNVNYKGDISTQYTSKHNLVMKEIVFGQAGPLNTTELQFMQSKVFHPQPAFKTPKCVALMTANLGEPEWLTISCNENVSSDISCEFTKTSVKTEQRESISDLFIYDIDSVRHPQNKYCFTFSSLPPLKQILLKHYAINDLYFLIRVLPAPLPLFYNLQL